MSEKHSLEFGILPTKAMSRRKSPSKDKRQMSSPRVAPLWISSTRKSTSSTKCRTLSLLIAGRKFCRARNADAIFHKQQLHITDVSLGECGSAINEIVIPHADEAIVETELSDIGQSIMEAFTPGV